MTGAPKCIVHGAGGTLPHLKEQQLHCDIKKGDRAFYFTTCGWMMWNWLVTFLHRKPPWCLRRPFLSARVGSIMPTTWGSTSSAHPRNSSMLGNASLKPMDTHDLSSIRTLTSTGSARCLKVSITFTPISRKTFVSSIAGTDIVGCFVGGNPTPPVWQGEIL